MKCIVRLIVLQGFLCLVCSLEFKYHSNAEIEEYLRNYTKLHPQVQPHMYSIGKTQKYTLWVLEVTKADKNDPKIPNIKLIANIHGNEAMGRELLLQFLEYIVTETNDVRVTKLLENTRIHVLPTMNPDGYSKATENVCEGVEGRTNGINFDLNRGFPDHFRQNNVPPLLEVKAVREWMKKVPFILSASYHSGEMVANYPFDTIPNDGKVIDSSHPRPSISPDDDVFRDLASTYAKYHPIMRKGNGCKNISNEFPGGIVNGASWYPFKGGMQDYNYIQSCMELTLEISCCKFPAAKELKKIWLDNKDATLEYCLKALMGIVGSVRDMMTNEPISNANLKISGRDMKFQTREYGQFWRILLPGTYTLEVSANGYHAKNVTFQVISKSELLNVDVFLLNNSYPLPTTTTTTTAKITRSPRKVSSVEPDEDKEPKLGFVVASGSKSYCQFFILLLMALQCIILM